jgi:hypothetical protein
VPRSTNDIDIVIAPTREQLRALLNHFPSSDYATDADDAFDAFSRKTSFSVVDYATLWKRDIVDIAGVRLQTASAEDILITKLWWAKLGPSERQINDAAGIVRVQDENLDLPYVERWIAALELEEQWRETLQRAR